MKKKKYDAAMLREELLKRYPALSSCISDFDKAFKALLLCIRNDGKMLLAGNGGSAADSEHIAGEMMKSFLFYREIDKDFSDSLESLYGEDGAKLARNLEGGIPAIPLTTMPAISTAFANDVNPKATFAQLVQTLGRRGDVFIGISTSGNSENILLALMAAKARGLITITLTGEGGGKCAGLSDICIRMPESETFKVQELHLPVYHALCAMLEAELFEERGMAQ